MDLSQDTFSLTQLAALTGTGKTRLRAMIEAGTLAATRAATGRQGWVVRREDALAANLQLRAEHMPGAVVTSVGVAGTPGVDAAMRNLLAEMLNPIETTLNRIEAQSAQLTTIVNHLHQRSAPVAQPRQVLKRICHALLKFVRRLLR